MKQHLKSPGLWLGLIALVVSFNATAQVGEGYYGPTVNIGTASHSVGITTNAFGVYAGATYDAFTQGAGADYFIGPNSVAGAQEIAGAVAPIFGAIYFNNGVNLINITNTKGIIVNGSAEFNNGVTTTFRSARAANLAGAIQFSNTATYSPAFTPVTGADTKLIDGFVSKVDPSSFIFPVGQATALQPITVSGIGTFTVGWSNANVAGSIYIGALPTGVAALNNNGYWEYSGSAPASVNVKIPNLSTFATAANLTIMGYNGTAWTNLGGSFVDNLENNSSTTAVTVPANITAIALGNTVAYILVSPAAFLQGAMSGTSMTKTLNTKLLLPTTNPYTVAPFNYTGIEQLPAAAPVNMTDWVLVDVRDQGTKAIVGTAAALLMSDGTITALDGVSPVAILGVSPGTYYVGLRHRNHLGIRSAASYALTTNTTTVDFRTDLSNVYTNTAILTNPAQKNMGNGLYAMWGGNATVTTQGATTIRVTGATNLNDFTALMNILAGASIKSNVYSVADFNLDGNVRSTGSTSINDFTILANIIGSVVVTTQHN